MSLHSTGFQYNCTHTSNNGKEVSQDFPWRKMVDVFHVTGNRWNSRRDQQEHSKVTSSICMRNKVWPLALHSYMHAAHEQKNKASSSGSSRFSTVRKLRVTFFKMEQKQVCVRVCVCVHMLVCGMCVHMCMLYASTN